MIEFIKNFIRQVASEERQDDRELVVAFMRTQCTMNNILEAELDRLDAKISIGAKTKNKTTDSQLSSSATQVPKQD